MSAMEEVLPEQTWRCPPDCDACADEAADIAEARARVLAFPDWYRLAGTVGVHPEDMRKFRDGEISLTAPDRERIRRATPEPPAAPPKASLAEPIEKSFRDFPGLAEKLAVEINNRAPVPGVTFDLDAPPCASCGELMVRNGVCHRCLNCGTTSGCS